jgi:hypothetical protein
VHREHIQFEATKCETSKITPNNHQTTSYHEKETTFSKNFLRWNLQKIFHPLEQTMMIQGKHAKQSAVFEAGLIVIKPKQVLRSIILSSTIVSFFFDN